MLVHLNEVLLDAQKNHYAVGLFNTIDSDMLQAAIDAAEKLRSPIIIGTAEVLLPYGELKLIAPALLRAAKQATVPVVVHFDHGLTFERCMEALKLGFSSIMFDNSVKEYNENLSMTGEMVKIAHAMGATVEGEIGHVGEAATGDGEKQDCFTTVSDAEHFIQATGVDALAIAIGNAHGVYKQKAKLDLKRLSDIRRAVDTPLVLHGGSGLSDDDFRNAVREGITKVNVFTDLCLAGSAAIKTATERGLDYLEMRNLKKNEIQKAIMNKMELFGSKGRA